MNEQLTPPKIAPVQATAGRPAWSVMLPVCNRLAYLRQTLDSVLAQDLGAGKMQICIVDNSTQTIDWRAWLTPAEAGRVEIFKQPAHVGMCDNWNTCIRQAAGELVHILHDDDWVLPGFYARMDAAAREHPEIAAFFARCFFVDEHGGLGWLNGRVRALENPGRNAVDLFHSNPFCCPAVVLRRTFYENHGGYLPGLVFTPDWEMWVRAVTRGGGFIINEPLAAYRYYSGNITNRLERSGETIRDTLRLASIWDGQHPEFNRAAFQQSLAEKAWEQAGRFRQLKDSEAERANLRLWRELAPWPRRVRRTLKLLASRLRTGAQNPS